MQAFTQEHLTALSVCVAADRFPQGYLTGNCTGEHGIGIGKREFMELEHGAGCAPMKSIKDLIDPKGLMNPGKMFL